MNRLPPLVAATFIVGYPALDWLSYIHPMQQFSITPWNPQPALAIALLMLGGQRWLPAVFAAVLAAEWIVRGGSPASASTLLIAAVLSLGYAAIARAMSGRFAVNPALESGRDAIRLFGVVAVGAFMTGILYVAALLASGAGPLDRPLEALIRFWIGDAVGIIVTLPFLLMLATPRRRAEIRSMLGKRETLAHALATAAALAIVFASEPGQQVKVFYVLFLPLVGIATRYGLVGSTLATLVIQGAVILTGVLAGYQELTVFELQALLVSLAVTALFLGVTVDERRRAEEDLRHSMRMAAAGEMAAALAHELNQPLAALSNYARASQLLAESPGADPAVLTQTLDKMVREAARAGEVVRRLRDFFRTGATRLEPVALDQVASRVVASFGTRAASLGVTLGHHVSQPIPTLLIDELQLEVVIRNLVANALEAAAARDGSRAVQVEIVREASGRVKTTVLDSGPGVASADAQRIFQPFETTRPAGMGMGLAISRAIVEAHGGELWTVPGQRGIFCFTLPAAEAP